MKNSDNKVRLFLIDGTALAYRAYFAMIRNPLINSKGVNTSGVYGFTNTLMKLLKDENPDAIACVFDTRGPTFRHRLYPEYKATREKMPDELADQFPLIKQVVEALNIPVVEEQDFEADDVIGTLAKQAEEAGMEVFLVTGDKDFMQLVTPRVKMYIHGQRRQSGTITLLDPDGVKEKVGLPPEKIIDYLGLMGDASDNVPGVPGVGPKTALALIEQFGSLKNALDSAEEVKRPKIRENLQTFREQALLSQELVTIKTDVSLTHRPDELHRQAPDTDTLIALFQELEFSRLIPDIPGKPQEVAERPCCRYRAVQSEEELDELVAILRRAGTFALDLETTALEPMAAEIVGLSFSWAEGEAAYVPVMLPESDRSADLFETAEEKSFQRVMEKLRPVLEDPRLTKCGQNIKYDWLVLKRSGIHLAGVDFDTMVAAYLINPSARRFNLDALSLEYLNIKKIATKDLIGSGKKQITMDEVPLKQIAEYACEDADMALRLRQVFEPMLKENGMDALFRDVEMPLVPVLLEMEKNGVALDRELLQAMSDDFQKQLDGLMADIYDIAGEEFNINSTQQLGAILFEKLKVHELLGKRRAKRTKTGYATDVKVLESLSAHPLPRKLLDYRQLTKLKSTYVDALPRLILPATGRVHASFNQTVAATGRLSTSNPNLQNIPIRTELGREIRKAFVPQNDGWELLSADYSQIELRLMAHLSGDETLLESFRNGEDVHRRTASEIFDMPMDEVDADHRRRAKTINFGIMYGMGGYGLASRLGIPFEEAQNFITAYFARYPRVNEFMASTIAKAHEQGYVTTLLNRRRYLPEIASDNRNIREFGERTAINTPIQGTAADMIKVAMIRIQKRLNVEQWQTKMILQIHDELLFETPEGEVECLQEMVRSEMESALTLNVPIVVDVGVGKNWFEAH